MLENMQLQQEEVLEALYRFAPIPNQPAAFGYYAAAMVVMGAAFQTPKMYRAAFFPVVATLVFGGLINAPTAFHEFAWCYDYALFMNIFFLICTYKLFIDPKIPSAPPGPVLDSKNLIRGYKIISDRDVKSPKSQNTRFSFLLGRLAGALTVGTVLALIPIFLFPGPFDPLDMEEFDPEHQTYFRRLLFGIGPAVTVRETVMRCAFVLLTGGGTALELIQCHTLLSIIMVNILFIDEPEDWPSLFSWPSKITSLRAFWSRFWHRVIVRTYAGLAGFFSEQILGLKPRGNADRFVVHALVFSISGGVHAVASWAFGQHCELWRDWAWFAGTFPAIVLEDGILAAVSWATRTSLRTFGVKSGSQSEERVVAAVKAVAGLCYLFWFFFWSVPKLYYPKTYCLPGAFG